LWYLIRAGELGLTEMGWLVAATGLAGIVISAFYWIGRERVRVQGWVQRILSHWQRLAVGRVWPSDPPVEMVRRIDQFYDSLARLGQVPRSRF
jgi:hypothetical protein